MELPLVGNKVTQSARIFVLSEIFFSVYLGFSMVYWLPGISVQALGLAKFGLVGTAVLVTYLVAIATDRMVFPKGLFGPLGFIALLLASFFGLIQAEASVAIDRLLDLVLSFTFLWSFYIISRAGVNVDRIFRFSVLIIAALCFLTVMYSITGIPNIQSPYGQSLSTAGFGAKRTGWSGGLALFFALSVLFIRVEGKNKFRKTLSLLGFLLIASSIMGSQIVSGGRAGIVASLAGILLFVMLSPARRNISILLIIAVVVAYFLQDFLAEHLRLYRIIGTAASAQDIDSFSSGRMSGYQIAIDLFKAKPLVGQGFGQVSLLNYGINYGEVHNLWLKLAMEAGLFLPLTLFGIVGSFLLSLLKRLRKDDVIGKQRTIIFGTVVAGGLLISLFEPNMLLGTFQNSAIWWAIVGVLIATKSRNSVDRSRREA